MSTFHYIYSGDDHATTVLAHATVANTHPSKIAS